MIEFDELLKLCEELESYTQWECDSQTETCDLLIAMANYPDYVSDEFYDAVGQEIADKLENYKKYSRIIEKEELVKQKVKYLEWIYD